jgi:hypothetical protein
MATDKEELYGTWVNMDYLAKPAQKIIIYPDGKTELYNSATAEKAFIYMFRYLITRKWSDPEGDIWYKYHWVGNWVGGEGFSFIKISNSGKTREKVYEYLEYPTKIYPEHAKPARILPETATKAKHKIKANRDFMTSLLLLG